MFSEKENRTVLYVHGKGGSAKESERYKALFPDYTGVTVPRLEQIKRAGKAYAETGSIPDDLLAVISSPMIPEEVYASIVDGSN